MSVYMESSITTLRLAQWPITNAELRSVLVESTRISGVYVIVPERHRDSRGFFSESWNSRRMAEHGLDHEFVQDNHSYSHHRGTIRGLHFQAPPRAQAKLVRCGRGKVFDIAVDIRRGSASYGEWVGEELSFENGKQMFIPAGFLHGFETLAADSEVIYKCTDFYDPACEGAVRFDDPDIAIAWRCGREDLRISEKDAAAPAFRQFESPFLLEEES